MDNKGRTLIYTFLVLGSVVALLAATSLVSAGKPAPTCGNEICDNGETADSCPADCGVVIESVSNVCHLFWSGVSEANIGNIGGNSDVSRCEIGGLCGNDYTYSTSCSSLDSEYAWGSGYAFYDWYTNNCGCSAKGTCETNVIDHTGCGWGNKGCGHNSPNNGKGVECLAGSDPVVSPDLKVGGTVQNFYEDGTVVANGCGQLCEKRGKYYYQTTSTSGACYYVTAYNVEPTGCYPE